MKLPLSWLLIFGICLACFCDVCLGKYYFKSKKFFIFMKPFRLFCIFFCFRKKGLRTVRSRGYRYRSSVRRIACTTPNITNGYFMKRREILWTFYCDPDFKLIGKSRINCKDGRFDDEIPICASLYRPMPINTVRLFKNTMNIVFII